MEAGGRGGGGGGGSSDVQINAHTVEDPEFPYSSYFEFGSGQI